MTVMPAFLTCVLAPNTGDGGLDFLLEAGDQFAVGGNQRLFGYIFLSVAEELLRKVLTKPATL